jgi:hypothetical protein
MHVLAIGQALAGWNSVDVQKDEAAGVAKISSRIPADPPSGGAPTRPSKQRRRTARPEVLRAAESRVVAADFVHVPVSATLSATSRPQRARGAADIAGPAPVVEYRLTSVADEPLDPRDVRQQALPAKVFRGQARKRSPSRCNWTHCLQRQISRARVGSGVIRHPLELRWLPRPLQWPEWPPRVFRAGLPQAGAPGQELALSCDPFRQFVPAPRKSLRAPARRDLAGVGGYCHKKAIGAGKFPTSCHSSFENSARAMRDVVLARPHPDRRATELTTRQSPSSGATSSPL